MAGTRSRIGAARNGVVDRTCPRCHGTGLALEDDLAVRRQRGSRDQDQEAAAKYLAKVADMEARAGTSSPRSTAANAAYSAGARVGLFPTALPDRARRPRADRLFPQVEGGHGRGRANLSKATWA